MISEFKYFFNISFTLWKCFRWYACLLFILCCDYCGHSSIFIFRM